MAYFRGKFCVEVRRKGEAEAFHCYIWRFGAISFYFFFFFFPPLACSGSCLKLLRSLEC